MVIAVFMLPFSNGSAIAVRSSAIESTTRIFFSLDKLFKSYLTEDLFLETDVFRNGIKMFFEILLSLRASFQRSSIVVLFVQ